MTTVDLVWFNAGGGHRAAALALEQVMAAQGRPWQVRRVNLSEALDPTQRFRRITGFAPEDLYNKRLASGFTLGLAQELRLLQGLIRYGHDSLVARLAAHWEQTQPDLVVSLIPNFNRALHDALALARPGIPFVTLMTDMTDMTDMADHPPNFWIEPDIEQHLICGTGKAIAQAVVAGCPARRLHLTSGMVMHPRFYDDAGLDRATERHRLGLDATTPTGLVMFGGTGSRVMKRIAERLPDTPLILLCGRNESLASDLRRQARGARAPRIVVGHTPDVPRWMQLADFFIGKPGPGSLSEAVQCGLPVIVTCNAATMPQERWNVSWVRQTGVGIVLRSFAGVDAAVARLIDELPALRAGVRRIENRAVFEVPDILARILADTRASSGTPPPTPPLRPRTRLVLATSNGRSRVLTPT